MTFVCYFYDLGTGSLKRWSRIKIICVYNISMNRREKQVQLKLDKISEASSPSPKHDNPPSEASSGRVIPFSSSVVSPLKKTQSKQLPGHSAEELSRLREEIMDRKMRLTRW